MNSWQYEANWNNNYTEAAVRQDGNLLWGTYSSWANWTWRVMWPELGGLLWLSHIFHAYVASLGRPRAAFDKIYITVTKRNWTYEYCWQVIDLRQHHPSMSYVLWHYACVMQYITFLNVMMPMTLSCITHHVYNRSMAYVLTMKK